MLLEQDAVETGAERLAAIREPTTRDDSIQCSQARICQPDKDLYCHTVDIAPVPLNVPCAQGSTDMQSPRLNAARVARLATTDPDDRPHLVPIVFALDGDTLYTAVDRKPKRSSKLRRIENARARPDVTVLVDHYEENWGRLWWIRLRGRARVIDDGEEHDHALALLQEKYPQYRAEPPEGPVLAVDVTEVREWSG
jgi:PPOX class probable F420-dependent enzyme